MKSFTVCASVLIGLCYLQWCGAQEWSRSDEQSKTRDRLKLPQNKAYRVLDDSKLSQTEEGRGADDVQSTTTFASDELAREHESNVKHTNVGKTTQANMEAFVKDLRSSTLSHRPYQTYENNEPFEQSVDGRATTLDADHDHDQDNIRIAVQSKRRYEFVPVHFDRDDMKAPKMIEIVSDAMPLRLHFKSQSAAIVVTQSHMSPPIKPLEETATTEEPYRLSHRVTKPVIQEVNEIIQPYRNIVQQVKPVIEDIRTIVPKDNDVQHQHQGGGTIGATNNRDTTNRPTIPTPMMMKPMASPLRLASPAHQLQGKFNARQVYDAVKGAESQPRIQRRMQLDDVSGGHRRPNHHYGQMQFGFSEPELIYVPRFPKAFGKVNARVNDNQRLSDYFASKGKYQMYKHRPMVRDTEDDLSELDREVAESGRLDTVYPDYGLAPLASPNEHTMLTDHYTSESNLNEDDDTDGDRHMFALNSADHFDHSRPMFDRCDSTGRCHSSFDSPHW